MEKYLRIANVNLRYNLIIHIAAALGVLLLAPFIIGTKNLDAMQTAQVLEMYVSIIGIIILIPVFMLEDDKSIDELMMSKKQPQWQIHLVRILEAIAVLIVFELTFLLILKFNSCTFPFWTYFYGSMSSCIFLGGLGILFYGVFKNLIVGYMPPVLYYLLSFLGGANKLGKFFLFSMMKGTVDDKVYILIPGIIMIMAGIILRNFKKR